MKLYNKSRIPTALIEPLLAAAGRAVCARTANVVVKVTQGRNRRVRGVAQRMNCVYTWHLRRVRKWKAESVSTDGGMYTLTVPTARPGWDYLEIAESIFKVAAHEWAHVRDYQAHRMLAWSHRGSGGRRPLHDKRPEELRAINAVDDAVEHGAVRRNADAILALAIWYEATAGRAVLRAGGCGKSSWRGLQKRRGPRANSIHRRWLWSSRARCGQ